MDNFTNHNPSQHKQTSHPFSANHHSLEHEVERDKRHWGRWTKISTVMLIFFISSLVASTFFIFGELSERSESFATANVIISDSVIIPLPNADTQTAGDLPSNTVSTDLPSEILN